VLARPEFRPDPALDRAGMERLQREIADAARFEDDHDLTSEAVALSEPLSLTAGETLPASGPCVAGVDVAVRENGDEAEAAAAAVAVADGRVVATGRAVVDLAIPYVPGLLAFREGDAVLAALDDLDRDPDLLVVDGSGRIHYRCAGLATHLGVTIDRPAVGVAKNLLCGRLRESVSGGLPEGARVAVEADAEYEYGAAAGEVVGYAVSTRQYDSPDRHVNPLYVSPGHRVGAESAAEFVLALAAGYKLPEPTRLADAYADTVRDER